MSQPIPWSDPNLATNIIASKLYHGPATLHPINPPTSPKAPTTESGLHQPEPSLSEPI